MRTTAISVDEVIRVADEGLCVDERAAEAVCAARDPELALRIFAQLAARVALAFKSDASDQKGLFEEMIRRAASEVLEEIGLAHTAQCAT